MTTSRTIPEAINFRSAECCASCMHVNRVLGELDFDAYDPCFAGIEPKLACTLLNRYVRASDVCDALEWDMGVLDE